MAQMEEVLILIDLANTTVFRGVHKPNPHVIGARLETFLGTLLQRAQVFAEERFCEFRIRLYDGWFDENGQGTELHGLIRQHLRGAYPIRRRGYRLFVDQAEAPIAANEERILHTFRVQAGLTRYHLSIVTDSPSACANRSHCGINSLRSWAKGQCPVPNCPIMVVDTAHYRQQKLVDTALVADLVWAASRRRKILVVSDDEDVLPGLITARAFGSKIGWVCRSDHPRPPYAIAIARQQIEYVKC